MRIAILAGPVDNQNAGVHVYTVQMIKALIENDKENEYILFREKHDEQFGNIRQVIVPNIQLPIGFASFRMFFIIPFLCIYHQVDAVIEPAHFGPFNLPKKTKRITVIHDLTPLLFPEMHRWHSRVLQQIFLKGILKRTDLIVANSLNTERDLHRVFPFTARKTFVVYPGVEELFVPLKNKEKLLKHNLSGDYFFSAGTIEPRKNLSLLVEAFDLFLLNNPDCNYKLAIAGGRGWKYEEFFNTLNQLKDRDSVQLLGYVSKDDLPVLYSSAKAFFYLSEYEGFGFPVAEAMACGTPVVTSHNSSLTEAGGKAVIYVKELTKENVAEVMEKFYKGKMDEARLRQEGKLQAKKFSWQNFGIELSNRINQLFQ